jgi:hypothetical protein
MSDWVSLAESILIFKRFEKNLHLAAEGILTEWATTVRDKAQSAIGTYKYGWTPLGPSAVARHGDSPLLDTSQLRDSITAIVQMSVNGGRAAVGTDQDVGVWQELGTSRIPPRSFLMESAVRSDREFERIASKYMMAAWVSAKAHGHEIGLLLHAIKGALEMVQHIYREHTREYDNTKHRHQQ